MVAGRLERVHRDLYRVPAAGIDPSAARAAAEIARLARMGVRAVAGGRTAAALHGLPWVAQDGRPAPVTLLVPPGSTMRRGRRGDVLVRATEVPASQVVDVRGIPATSRERTAVDLARGALLPWALVPLDAALRHGCLDRGADRPWIPDAHLVEEVGLADDGRAALAAVVSGMRRWTRVGAVPDAVRLADPRAESPLESLSRGWFHLAGLPPPQPQLAVPGDAGQEYRGDLGWPRWRVVGEADGRGKYDRPGVLYAEKTREDSLRRAGWTVVRWTWDEIVRSPDAVVARVAGALRAAGAPVMSPP